MYYLGIVAYHCGPVAETRLRWGALASRWQARAALGWLCPPEPARHHREARARFYAKTPHMNLQLARMLSSIGWPGGTDPSICTQPW